LEHHFLEDVTGILLRQRCATCRGGALDNTKDESGMAINQRFPCAFVAGATKAGGHEFLIAISVISHGGPIDADSP
jgi:hypothetical protein